MKNSFKFIIVSVCILLALNSFTQNLNTSLAGHWGYGTCYAFDVKEDYAFIGSGCMFLVLDISNPEEPIEVASLLLPDLIRDIAIEGSFAFIANDQAGLLIVDISNR